MKNKNRKKQKKTEKYLFPTLQTQAGTVTCKARQLDSWMARQLDSWMARQLDSQIRRQIDR